MVSTAFGASALSASDRRRLGSKSTTKQPIQSDEIDEEIFERLRPREPWDPADNSDLKECFIFAGIPALFCLVIYFLSARIMVRTESRCR